MLNTEQIQGLLQQSLKRSVDVIINRVDDMIRKQVDEKMNEREKQWEIKVKRIVNDILCFNSEPVL